jgi:hypothetical protein
MTLAASTSTLAAWRPAITRTALLLMESLWVYAFVAFFVAAIADGGRPSPLGAAAVVFASFAISRLLQLSELALGVVRIWGIFLSFLIFYAVIRIDFFGDWRLWDFSWADSLFFNTEATVRQRVDAAFGVPALWGFWVRGVLRGQQRTGFDDVIGSFAVGVCVIAFVELFAAGTSDVPRAVAVVPVPFVAIGLLAIALSHAARSEDEFSRSFAPTWIVAVGGAVVLLAGVALLFVLVDYSWAAGRLGDLVEAIGWVVAQVFYYVTLPILWVIEQMFIGISYLVDELWGAQRRTELTPAEEEQEQQEQPEPKQLPAWAQLLSRILIGGAIVTALIVGTALMFRRYVRRSAPEGVKESIYSEGRLAMDLGNMLGSLLGRLRPNLHFGGPQLDPARRLYFDVLKAAGERGVERRSGETPLELSPRLEREFAAETPQRITQVFDDVRYGALPPPAEEVQRLRLEWEGVEKSTEPR